MACLSLTSLPLVCGSEGVIAGVSRLYMIAHKDLKAVTGSPFPYVIATSGVVNEISLQTGKTFVEVGLIKNTSGINETGVFNENGTSYSTVELTLSLLDITAENITFVNSVKRQDVAAIAQDKQGRYYAIGFNGGLRTSALTATTGTADADAIGYNLTFTGNDTFGLKPVESAAALEAIAPVVVV